MTYRQHVGNIVTYLPELGVATVDLNKLDGVGPFDNIPSPD